MVRRPRVSAPGKKKRKGFQPKTAPKTKTAQVKLIKSVIARENETKFRSEIVSDRITHNSQIGFADIINCLPKLVQDQGEGAIYERLGRKIRPVKHQFQIEVAMTDVNRSNNIIVHLWILKNRQVNDFARLDSTNTPTSRLLMLGSSAQYQSYNGYAQDGMLPINTSQFVQLHHKKFYLGKNTGTLQDSTTSGNQPTFASGNLVKKFVFNLKTPAMLTYEQDNNSPRVIYYPSNYAPFCVVGYQHVSNGDPDYMNQDIIVTARANLFFDDA